MDSDRDVERAVRELNALCRSATLDFALAVGRLVIDAFYGGDLCAFRRRDPAKRDSLRKLARHPDLAMTPDALYRSVAMYELWQRVSIGESKHLSTSHLRLVLPLAEAEQERLLRATEAGRWSVRRLDEEIGALVVRDPSTRIERGGKKRQSRLREAVQAARRCAGTLHELLSESGETVEVSPESTRRAVETLRAVQEACARLERQLLADGPVHRALTAAPPSSGRRPTDAGS